jgi:hypothetical protein
MPYLSETFSSRFEAELAVEFLAEHEIEARVSASDAGGSIPSMQVISAVRIDVSEEDSAPAELLVRGWRSSEESSPKPLSRSERLQSWLGGALILVLLGVVLFSIFRSTPTTEPVDVPIQAQSPW